MKFRGFLIPIGVSFGFVGATPRSLNLHAPPAVLGAAKRLCAARRRVVHRVMEPLQVNVGVISRNFVTVVVELHFLSAV